jgi:WD repeat-containing protein 55
MPDIPVGAQIFDLVFHPTLSIVYTASITGEIKSFTYDEEGQHCPGFTQRPSKRSCRGVALNDEGTKLWAIGKNKAL